MRIKYLPIGYEHLRADGASEVVTENLMCIVTPVHKLGILCAKIARLSILSPAINKPFLFFCVLPSVACLFSVVTERNESKC